MKDESGSTKDYQENLHPLHVGVVIVVVCVLTYLAYCVLKKIATVEAKLPHELAYEPIEFNKQSISDISELLES